MEESEEPSTENEIFIGNKPVMNYVLAVITQVNEGAKEIVLKARGRVISKCVDVAETVRNRFLQNLDITDIETGTEKVEREEGGGTTNVSTISIRLEKSE